MLRGVYGDFQYHNDRSHLDGEVADDASWQHCWRRLATQLAIWYTTTSGAVGLHVTAILDEEWRGVLGRSWNSKRPFVFLHFIITKSLGVHRAKEIQARITRQTDLWERGLHAGLVGDAEAEGAAREGRAASGGEEEDEDVARSYHDTVMLGKIRQAVCQATDREG